MSQVAEVQVTLEDQQNINTFGKLNQRLHEVDAEIAAKQRNADDLEDAANELIVAEEDEIRYGIGECFYHATQEEAEQRLEAAKAEIGPDLEKLKAEKSDIQRNMAALKTVLYGKFGNNINLEE